VPSGDRWTASAPDARPIAHGRSVRRRADRTGRDGSEGDGPGRGDRRPEGTNRPFGPTPGRSSPATRLRGPRRRANHRPASGGLRPLQLAAKQLRLGDGNAVEVPADERGGVVLDRDVALRSRADRVDGPTAAPEVLAERAGVRRRTGEDLDVGGGVGGSAGVGAGGGACPQGGHGPALVRGGRGGRRRRVPGRSWGSRRSRHPRPARSGRCCRRRSCAGIRRPAGELVAVLVGDADAHGAVRQQFDDGVREVLVSTTT
jgi:hypothetical protein